MERGLSGLRLASTWPGGRRELDRSRGAAKEKDDLVAPPRMRRGASSTTTRTDLTGRCTSARPQA